MGSPPGQSILGLAELTMQQPTRFQLGVNQKAAKALGVMVPQSMLLRAAEVIE
jgi:putative ABC transport system substrate-binding protein